MAGAGRRTFQPGEVLTASNVNSYLMDQSVMRFASSAARGSAVGTAVIAEGMVSYLQDLDQIQVFDGSDWQQVYPSVANAGEIINVVSTAKTNVFTTTSQTFVTVTGLSATITPKSSTSKFLIIAQISNGLKNNGATGHFKVTRGGTDIYIGDAGNSQIRGVFGGFSNVNIQALLISNSIIYLDSPGTTSAVTYQVETRTGAAATTVYVNRPELDSVGDVNLIRGASSITVLEIAA